MGSALASGGSVLESAGIGSIRHGGSCWHLLTEATPVAPCYHSLAMQTHYTKSSGFPAAHFAPGSQRVFFFHGPFPRCQQWYGFGPKRDACGGTWASKRRWAGSVCASVCLSVRPEQTLRETPAGAGSILQGAVLVADALQPLLPWRQRWVPLCPPSCYFLSPGNGHLDRSICTAL